MSKKKSIAIHQPNYLSWLGFFCKIYLSDVFVFHDNVEFSKKGFIQRTHIRKVPNQQTKIFLSIPLKKHSDYILIKDLEIDHSQNWTSKHLNKIKNTYLHAPFFKSYFPFFEHYFKEAKVIKTLATFNSLLSLQIVNLLKKEIQFFYSSKLPVNGKASSYNLNIIEYLDADLYISGMGAKNYQSENDFVEKEIDLFYLDFFTFLKDHPYPQVQGDFLNGLSILDALFNIGADGIINLFEEYKDRYFSYT